MRMLSLHPNVPRYWLKLSTSYETENLARAHLCLRLAHQYSTPHSSGLVDRRLTEFLEKNPSFKIEAALVTRTEDLEEPCEEFKDLGSSAHAKQSEAMCERKGSGQTAAPALNQELFVTEFENKWFG